MSYEELPIIEWKPGEEIKTIQPVGNKIPNILNLDLFHVEHGYRKDATRTARHCDPFNVECPAAVLLGIN